MTPTEQYSSRINQFSIELKNIKKKYSTLGTARLVLAILFIYFLYKVFSQNNYLFCIPALLVFAGFVLVVSNHRKVLWNKKITENLLALNKQETNYLTSRVLSYKNGEDYINPAHFYTFDLDIFGTDSLFHHLNRSTTFVGEKTLAMRLMNLLTDSEIPANQNAIKELAVKLDWRQYLSAVGMTVSDTEEDYEKLLEWSVQKQNKIVGTVKVLSFLLPAFYLGVFSLVVFGILSIKWLTLLFVVNLIFFGTQSKKIKSEVIDAKNIAKIIKHYGLILKSIEQENFGSDKLKQLQQELRKDKASEEIKKLSAIFLKIQGVNFDLGAIFLNGTVSYHTHTLHSLIKWKDNKANSLKKWLDIIGEIESLNSLANLGYNNSDFVYPKLNSDFTTSFTNLGHPLISRKVRITNSVTLDKSNFVILTGSNMSGKSTFLRTLGINMVLTGVGAPICATEASVHPLPILVSMRQSDSLSSGESYFFAEVKRLKSIIERLKTETCFVLLDEILRGTNSDDKQSGTIGVIQKIISLSAVGGIATHDLEVCGMTKEYPDKLENKNFEVEIINDELVFDYKLRNGVCQNKSATFLMKKMEII